MKAVYTVENYLESCIYSIKLLRKLYIQYKTIEKAVYTVQNY